MTVQIADTDKKESRLQRLIEILFKIFLRLLAVMFFAAAIYTWMQAIGYWEGSENRFDTMGTALRIYTAIMVVMLPVTSVGLWTTLPWGRVVWFFAIGFHTVSVLRFPGMFPFPTEVLILHFSCLGIYMVFQILLFFITKKE